MTNIKLAVGILVVVAVGCGGAHEGGRYHDAQAVPALNLYPWPEVSGPVQPPAGESPPSPFKIVFAAPQLHNAEQVAELLEPVTRGQRCRLELQNYQYELRCEEATSEEQVWEIARAVSSHRGVENVEIADR